MHPNVPFACTDADTATCSDCESGTCSNPILSDILMKKTLTSGYMGIFSDAKPTGIISNVTPKHINLQ